MLRSIALGGRTNGDAVRKGESAAAVNCAEGLEKFWRLDELESWWKVVKTLEGRCACAFCGTLE